MRTIILGPIRKMFPSYDELKDEADDRPWHIVHGRGRGNLAKA